MRSQHMHLQSMHVHVLSSSHDDHLFPLCCQLGPVRLGPAGSPLRRALPRRPGCLDGRDGASVDRVRPRPDDLAAAVDRLWLRPRLRRLPAARRPGGRPARPPAGPAARARRLHRRLGPRRRGERRDAARRHPLPQGRIGRVHRAGRAVDHHDALRRGAGAQPRPRHLHRDRRERVLLRPRVRRVADRARLALDVPAAGADRAEPAARRPTPAARRPRGSARAPSVRPAGRRHADRGHAAAGPHHRRGARARLGLGANRCRLRHIGGSAGRVRRRRAPQPSAARAPGDPRARARWCARSSAPWRCSAPTSASSS